LNSKLTPSSSEPTDLVMLHRYADIPTLPIVAQKLVQTCHDENANFEDFARLIESDQGLASRLLGAANSAFYAVPQGVKTVQRAVSVLGLKQVRSIALGFHLAKTTSALNTSLFDMQDFWRQCLTRAALSRQLAARCCPEVQEEAFLVGLLEDCGVPILVEFYGEPYAKFWSAYHTSPAALLQLEHECFPLDHVSAAVAVAQKWNLPEALGSPISNHHLRAFSKPSESDAVKLCQIAYFVGNLSLGAPNTFCQDDFSLQEFAQQVLALSESDLAAVFQDASDWVSATSGLFSDVTGKCTDMLTLLLEAKDILVRLQQESNRTLFDCEMEIRKLREASVTVEGLAGCFPKDELTGLVTRTGLLFFLEDNCKRVRQGETSLTVMFVDLDNFKAINDTYGHLAGDGFLRDFAALLEASLPPSSCVSRYGGDEFVVAVLGWTMEQAAQAVHQLIARTQHRHPDLPYRSTTELKSFSCSTGMLFCDKGSNPTDANEVIELADAQMYAVKQTSKNGLSWQVLPVNDAPLRPQQATPCRNAPTSELCGTPGLRS